MRGEDITNRRVLVRVRTNAQPTETYYLCRSDTYKQDLLVIMRHAARHEKVNEVHVTRLNNDVISVEEIKRP